MGVFGITQSRFYGTKTMCVEGLVKGTFVLVLIDSDVTHTFINLVIMDALGIFVSPAKPVCV